MDNVKELFSSQILVGISILLFFVIFFFTLNPLSPDSDKNEISLYIITNCSNFQVMRIKEVITKDKMS